MLRAYLIIVLVIGVTASMLTGVGSPPKAVAPQQTHIVGQPGTQAETAPAPMIANVDGAVQLQREQNGHFYADVDINGTPIRMLIDTGATGIALSRDDARRAGIATSIGMPNVVGQGADGSVHGEFVTIDKIALGEKSVDNMPAMVLNGGQQSLLGQTFLAKFAFVEIHGDTMTLR